VDTDVQLPFRFEGVAIDGAQAAAVASLACGGPTRREPVLPPDV